MVSKRGKKSFLFLVLLVVMMLAAGGAAASDEVINAEDSIVLRDTFDGRYGIVTGGIGLIDFPSGTITLEVVGTPVKAVLMWTGRLVTGPGDDTVTVDINGGGAESVTANTEWRFSSFCCEDHAVYERVLDPTDFSSGTNTITVSDFGTNVGEPHGATLTIISTDPTFPNGVVRRYAGLDGFWYGWTGVFGPNSMVVCEEFGGPIGEDGFMNVTFMAGGVETENRGNSIWYLTGTGPLPTTVIGAPGAVEIDTGVSSPYPFSGTNNQNGGDDLDVVDLLIFVDAGEEWTCYQIESLVFEDGASLLWFSVGSQLYPVDPTAVNLQNINVVSQTGFYALIMVATLVLAVGTAYYLRRK